MFIVHHKRNIMSHIIMFLFGYSIANAKHPTQVNKTRLSLIHSELFCKIKKQNKNFEVSFQISKLSDFVKIKNSLSHTLEDY